MFMDSYDEYKEEKKKELEFLDTLDILPLLKNGISSENLLKELYKFNDEYDGDDMFAALAECDVIEYIEERFRTTFSHMVLEWFYLSGNPQKNTRYDDGEK